MRKEELLDFASYLHGHLGPFLVLGLKAGLLANKLIGRDPMGNLVRVYLPMRRPYTCFLDGVQVATGCTLGKLNIKVFEATNEIRMEICGSKASLVIEVKKEILKEILESFKSIPMEEEALKIWNREDSCLFTWKML